MRAHPAILRAIHAKPRGPGHERHSQGQSIRLAGYFPAHAHKQNYDVDDIPASLLTHVIYAFAGLQTDGTRVSVDTSDDNTNIPLLFQLPGLADPDFGWGRPRYGFSLASPQVKQSA